MNPSKVQYSKEGQLGHRIIKMEDINEIAVFFENLVLENGGENQFRIDFSDKSSLSGDTAGIFAYELFHRKSIDRISFTYKNWKVGNELRLILNEARYFSDITNSYELTSKDEFWFNAVSQQLNDLVSGIRKVSLFRRFFNFPWILVTYVFFQILIACIMALPFGFEFGQKTENVQIFIPVILYVILVSLLFIILTVVICFLYPEMEFALDSHRYVTRRKIRSMIGWISSAILIPVLITLIMQ